MLGKQSKLIAQFKLDSL